MFIQSKQVGFLDQKDSSLNLSNIPYINFSHIELIIDFLDSHHNSINIGLVDSLSFPIQRALCSIIDKYNPTIFFQNFESELLHPKFKSRIRKQILD